MRWIFVALVWLTTSAHAQPISYQLKLDVPAGQKPQIRITGATSVTGVTLELDRDDGKHFTIKQGALARNQAVTLAVGDGAAGKASYQGTISSQQPAWSDGIKFDTVVRPALKVGYDAEHLDLDKQVLQFTMSRPAGAATLTAIGEDGGTLGEGAATYERQPAGTWLAISWKQPAKARVLMLKLHAESSDAGAIDVELVPWSVTIDHEDVKFATDSAVIADSEQAKLAASVAKIAEIVNRSEKFVKMRLYVAGHTDTVGPSAKNKQLSLDRARAIAQYFRKHGIALPLAYAGFGEDVLKVPTKDNTDEAANRRADYVLGPVGAPPPFKGPYLKAHASWAELK
ncbi:MAG TPA: OmpA family protein [Kofleriaceae bacterium]|nr:OmpA family protein [Kofleriaceae bacterium]